MNEVELSPLAQKATETLIKLRATEALADGLPVAGELDAHDRLGIMGHLSNAREYLERLLDREVPGA